MNFRPSTFLTSFAFFLAVPLAGATEGVWKIEQNLPANHPCAVFGGVWRGWCMDMVGIRHASIPSRLTRTGGNVSPSYPCVQAPVANGERVLCYRDWRRALWGE